MCAGVTNLEAVLPCSSAHLKVVRRTVISSYLENSLMKSCEHKPETSLWAQAKCLRDYGYPLTLLNAVAQKMIENVRRTDQLDQS